MSRISGWIPPLFLLLQSCEILTFENRLEYPELTIQPNPEVQDFSTSLTTDFPRLGNQPFVSYGLCWNTVGSPGLDDSTSVNVGRPPIPYFTTFVTDLKPQTRYYVRAYAMTGKRTSFSEELTFVTLPQQRPAVETGELVSEGPEHITFRGRLGHSGASAVSDHGFCWHTSPEPTIANARTQLGAGAPGLFTSVLPGLKPATRYYLRAYATNGQGTTYGAEISLTKNCQNGPTMGASGLSSVTASTALATGSIASRGCSDIIEYGHCWSTKASPDVASTRSVYSNGTTGNFNSAITDLKSGTLYYIRSYATNLQGTTYGNQLTFTTSKP
jgi:hypothetical protein